MFFQFLTEMFSIGIMPNPTRLSPQKTFRELFVIPVAECLHG